MPRSPRSEASFTATTQAPSSSPSGSPLPSKRYAPHAFGGPVPIPTDVTEVDKRDARHAQRLAEQGAPLAGEAGFQARALWVADERRIADPIVEGAEELDADLIVMRAHGLTGVAAFLGSVSNHVLQHKSRPILVVARTEGGASRRVPRKGGTRCGLALTRGGV